MTAGAITREIADAGRGVGRLIRDDPRWPDGFNPTAEGFLRSFLGPLLALPFYLVATAAIGGAGGSMPVTNRMMGAAGASHLMDAVGFPILVAALARPLGVGAGYVGFIIILNWASLFVNIATAAISPIALAGGVGFNLFGFVWMGLFAVSLLVIWRAARATLSPEIPIALMMVVLRVGFEFLTDQVASAAFGSG